MNKWLLVGFFLLLSVALSFVLYPLRKSRIDCLLLSPIVVFFAVIAYWHWGAWPSLQKHQQQQIKQQRAQALLKSMNGTEGIIKALRSKLTDTPDSAQGWFLLGRLYASQNQWANACAAFKLAHRFQPDNDKTAVNYAQSLWELNHQQFNRKIRRLLKTVLKHNANQPDALAMLAMDAFKRHAYQDAIDYWQRLLKLIPSQSEEALSIRKAIAKAVSLRS